MTDEQTPDETAGTQREEIAAEPAEPPGAGEMATDETREDVVKRSPAGVVVAVVVVLAVIAIGIWVAMRFIRPDARELLSDTVAKYKQAQEIHVESTMSYEMSMGDQQNTMTMPTTAWFSRPNNMLFESGDEMQRTRAVCDGENLYLEIGMFPGVIKLPAPEDLAGMPLDRLSMSAATGTSTVKLPDIASILSGAFEPGELGTVQYGIDEADDWLAGLEAPENAWALTIHPETGPTVTVWIDRTERLVRKYATGIDYEAMVAANQALAQQIEQLPEERQQMLREMITRIDVDVSTVELGKAPPEGTFSYEPAEGTEVVEADSIEEGVRKLMTSMMGGQQPPGEE